MILSLDIGSTSVRALLFDDRGAQLPQVVARRPSLLRQTTDGGMEGDPEAIFALVAECIDEVLLKARAGFGAKAARIDGVAFSTFWHSVLGVARDGTAATPLFTLADCRSAAFADRMADSMDVEAYRQRTGCFVHSSYPAAKLLWLRETRPTSFATVAWWCSIGEYIYGRIFSKRACSVSLASGTGLWNRRRLAWDAETLAAVGISEDLLSPVVDGSSPLRGLEAPLAERWPALRDVPWFPAVADGACNNIGCGCSVRSRVAVMIGTTGAMRVAIDDHLATVPGGLWCYSVDRDRALLGGALANGGDLREWMMRTLRVDMPSEELDAELLARSPAAHGLTVLPFLSGERSTGWLANARAAVLGMDGGTSALDILQAGMEAVAYRFAAIWRLLREAVPEAVQLVGTGGALYASRAWTSMVADALGVPVTLSRVSEASCRGAALLVLEATGAIGKVEDADPLFGDVIEPRPDRHELHEAAMARFDELYRRLFSA